MILKTILNIFLYDQKFGRSPTTVTYCSTCLCGSMESAIVDVEDSFVFMCLDRDARRHTAWAIKYVMLEVPNGSIYNDLLGYESGRARAM